MVAVVVHGAIAYFQLPVAAPLERQFDQIPGLAQMTSPPPWACS